VTNNPVSLKDLGLSMADPITAFWAMLGRRIGGKLEAICVAIGEELRKTYLIATVRAFTMMLRYEVVEVITKNGGVGAWAVTIENMTGKAFQVIPSTVPGSAKLAGEGSSGGSCRALYPLQETVGQKLTKTNELDHVAIPLSLLHASHPDTEDPQTTMLSSNDCKAMTTVIFIWVAFTYSQISSCSLLFAHLVEQFKTAFQWLPMHGSTRKTWARMFRWRWINGRKTAMQVNVPVHLSA
jgi:hypothetical protein